MSDPRMQGTPGLAVVVTKGSRSVHVCVTWRSGYKQTWYWKAFDGISARRTERAVQVLIEEGMIKYTDHLTALGFNPILLVEDT